MELGQKPIQEIYGKLNRHKEMVAAFKWGFISIDDPRISEEKRNIYQAMAKHLEKRKKSLHQIPFIQITAIGVPAKKENESVIRFVEQLSDSDQVVFQEGQKWFAFSGPNQPKPFFQEKDANRSTQTHDSWLFDLLQNATEDNADNYTFSLYLDDPSLAKIYILEREHEASEKKKIKANAKKIIEEWLKIRTKEDIQDLLGRLINPDGTEELQFHLRNWAYHVKNVLFNNPLNRLYPFRNARADGFVLDGIEFLVVDHDSTEKNWSDLLVRYRDENPGPRKFNYLSPSIEGRPHDYHILDKSKISFIAYDTVRGRMIGYSTFSVTDLNYMTDGRMPFRSKELIQLDNIQAIEHKNGKDENTLGYVLYHLDGLHVHKSKKYKPALSNGMSIAKMLIFPGMDFIRHTYKLLGVKMIISSVFSSAMKQILVGGYGFTHYNRENDSKWLRNLLDDFWKIANNKSTTIPEVPTPSKLLTIKHIRNTLNGFLVKYYSNIYISTEGRSLTRPFIQSVITDLDKLITVNGVEMSAVIGSGAEYHAFRVEFQEIMKRLIQFQEKLHQEWVRAENKPSTERDIEYMKDLRPYLEVEEDNDTFLFLAYEKGPPQFFLNALDNFPLTKVIVIDDDDDDGLEEEEPTEEEMILYQRILELLKEKDIREKEVLPEDELKQLKEEENEKVERIKQLYEERDLVEKRINELTLERDRIEVEIEENEKSRKEIASRLDSRSSDSERMEYKRAKEEYQDQYLEIGKILLENYLKRHSLRFRLMKDPVSVARKELDEKMASIGYDMWRNDDFDEWRIEKKRRSITLFDVVRKLRIRYPSLLDYTVLENEEMDVIEISAMKLRFVQNFIKKYGIPEKEQAIGHSAIERAMTQIGFPLEGRNSLGETVRIMKTRFPLLLNYDEFIL